MSTATRPFLARALGVVVIALCGLTTGGCAGDAAEVRYAEASLAGVPPEIVTRFEGRWFNYPRLPVVVIDGASRRLAVDAPPGLTIEHVHSVDDELRILVSHPQGERRELVMRLVDDDLLMIVPVDDALHDHAFLAERLSSFDETKYSLLKLAGRSAERVDDGLDWLVRKL